MDTQTVGPPAPPDNPPAPGEPLAYARILLDDLTIGEAADLVEDGSWFHETRLPILFHFSQVGLDDYWQLTVKDHRELYEFIEARG